MTNPNDYSNQPLFSKHVCELMNRIYDLCLPWREFPIHSHVKFVTGPGWNVTWRTYSSSGSSSRGLLLLSPTWYPVRGISTPSGTFPSDTNPQNITQDGGDNIYLAFHSPTSNKERLYRVNVHTGAVLAWGIEAGEASDIVHALSVFFYDGEVYVLHVDQTGQEDVEAQVSVFSPSGVFLRKWTISGWNWVYTGKIHVVGGFVFVSASSATDPHNPIVRAYTTGGAFSTSWSWRDSMPATEPNWGNNYTWPAFFPSYENCTFQYYYTNVYSLWGYDGAIWVFSMPTYTVFDGETAVGFLGNNTLRKYSYAGALLWENRWSMMAYGLWQDGGEVSGTGFIYHSNQLKRYDLPDLEFVENLPKHFPTPTWYAYRTDQKEVMSSPVDVDGLAAAFSWLEPPGADVVAQHIIDMRNVIEALVAARIFLLPGTNQPYTWASQQPHDLYLLAMGDRTKYGATGGSKNTWTRTEAEIIGSTPNDIDIGEIFECVKTLEEADTL